VTSFPPEGFTHPEIPDFHVPPGDIAIGLNGGTYDFGIDINGGTGMLHATTEADWFVFDDPHAVDAQGEHTHFSGGTVVGPVDVVYESMGLLENEFDTFRIEVAVPLSYLGYPDCGATVYTHWVCGCRNDASGNHPILKLTGDLDGMPSATDATSWSSVKALFR